MPIYDINDSEIMYHPDFATDVNIYNLEVGAGKNYFGKKFYPLCYLTDSLAPKDLLHFREVAEYNEENCHFLDSIVDFFYINSDRTFRNIIFCNPIMVGFYNEVETERFFTKANELLEDNGQIIVIGHKKNGWSKYSNARHYLQQLQVRSNLFENFQIDNLEELGENHEIRNHCFLQANHLTPTVPNEKFIIQKLPMP